MAKRQRRKSARPIASRRDFDGASAVAKHLSSQPERDTAAELRLQSLLKELDKFDDTADGASDGPEADDFEEAALRRRWSDDD